MRSPSEIGWVKKQYHELKGDMFTPKLPLKDDSLLNIKFRHRYDATPGPFISRHNGTLIESRGFGSA